MPSRAMEPLTPERSDEENCSTVTYYLPMYFTDEDTLSSDSDLGLACVDVHDTARNGAESGGGLTRTYNVEP